MSDRPRLWDALRHEINLLPSKCTPVQWSSMQQCGILLPFKNIPPTAKKKALAPLAICEAKSHFISFHCHICHCHCPISKRTCMDLLNSLDFIGTYWHHLALFSMESKKDQPHIACVLSRFLVGPLKGQPLRGASPLAHLQRSPQGPVPYGIPAWLPHMGFHEKVQSQPGSPNVDMPKETNENCRPSGSSGCLGPDGKVCNWIWRTLFHFHKLEKTGLSQSKTNKPLL